MTTTAPRTVPKSASYAVGRFQPDGPVGFRAQGVPDATVRDTREAAEHDWLAHVEPRDLYADRDTAQPGDQLHPDDVPGLRGPACYAHGGAAEYGRDFVCTLHEGHGGPQHVATTFGYKVTATWGA